MAGDGEEPAREVLRGHELRSSHAQARDPCMGVPDRCHRTNPEGFCRRSVMIPLLRLLNGIRALFRGGSADEELDAELHAFLEAAVDEKIRSGMSREQATRAARLELGLVS